MLRKLTMMARRRTPLFLPQTGLEGNDLVNFIGGTFLQNSEKQALRMP
jgi:hypothetical protein